MVFKGIAAVLLWLLVTLTSAFGFMASELEIASSDFFYETLDPVEQNDLGTRDTCWENGWLSYDTTSGYCDATNKGGLNLFRRLKKGSWEELQAASNHQDCHFYYETE
jgi:hypothetical protein